MASPKSSPKNNDEKDDSQSDAWLFQDDTLRELALLARDENLGEIEIESGAKRVSLRANPDREIAPIYAPQSYAAPQVVPQAGAVSRESAPAISNPATSPAETKNANAIDVVSPMVGVFYRAPSPSDPSFVEVGDSVEIGQTLGLVETMKVFNEITSEVAGVVTNIKVESAQLVETGDVLMTIEGAGH